MNDQKIYELMAKTPDIRAVQICDALDVELVDVSAALRSLVDIGDVVKHSGIGPNGIPAQMYNLSAQYKKSREGAALLARTGATPRDPAPSAPAAAPPTAAHPQLAPSRSKVDRAVAHVLKHGSATDDELRTAMGIAKPYAPSAYLGAAVKAGKLHKDGAAWKPGRAGNAKPAETPVHPADVQDQPASPAGEFGTDMPAPAVPAEPALEEPAAKPDSTTLLAPVHALHIPRFVPAPDEPARAAVYRCALWSDGILEVQKDGLTVAEMPQAAGESLAAFLARLANQKEAA